jgi:lysophospholipase L1-like esterase
LVLEQFIIDADIIWDQVGKTFFENPEAKAGRIMRVQVVNAGVVEDLTGYTLNLGWTSVRDPSKFGLDAFDDVDITKGIFEIDYTSEMLTNIGPLNASLLLVPPGDGRPIESNNFKLTVKNSAINAEAIQGENSFSTLETALVKVNGWNARIDDVEQEFKDRADALDGAYPVRLTAAEQSVAAVEAQVDMLNRGLGETMPTMASLLAAYPSGDTRDHIVAGNIAEVDTLTVTGVPTTAGNVMVTLNGVAVNVPVTVGVAEVASLLVTAVPTVAGNVTINLNGVPITVALDPAVQTTTDLVAAAIRAATFTGWTTGGTGSTVTFTATAVGTKTDATFSAGTTGATGTMTTTTQGVGAATTTTVATAIRAATFTGWTTGGTGAVVTFTATTSGTRTAPVFSGGTTGTTGTFVRTAIGETANFHRYFWNGSAWTDGGAYQAVEVVDDSIALKKIKNTESSKNINDPLNAILGKYMDPNGTTPTNSGYNIYGPFNVTQGETVRSVNTDGANTKFRKVAAKNSSGQFSVSDGFDSTLLLDYYTVPADITQIYVSISSHWPPSNIMIYKGDESTIFIQPYKRTLNDLNIVTSNLNYRAVTSEKIGIGEVKTEHVDFIAKSDNIFEFETITDNAFKELNGSVTNTATYFYSDYIIVSEGDVIKASHRFGRNVHLRKVTAYTAIGTVQSGLGQDGGSVTQVVDAVSTYTVPTGINLIIISISKTNANGSLPEDLMISIGSDPPTFVEYGETLQDVHVPLSNVQGLVATLDVMNNALIDLGGAILEGKTLLNLGDSIAAGAGNTYGDGLTAKAYGKQIAEKNGMVYVTVASGGATLSRQFNTNNLCRQIDDAIVANVLPNYILIEGGTNDISAGATQGAITTGYGEADTFNQNTSIGALEYCFRRMRDVWPTVKTVFVRVHNMSSRDAARQKELGNAILDVCEKWGVPPVDLYKEGGMNTNLVNVRNLYCNWTYTPETGDGTHPNTLAYSTWYVPPIEVKMKSI